MDNLMFMRLGGGGAQQLDKLVGLAMLVAASVVFLYYTIWTLLMVYMIRRSALRDGQRLIRIVQPFVDSDHPLQNVFPPRVWAIRIPVILILLASAVVGSFLSVVMIRSNRKRAAKAKAAGKKKA
ncbi:Dolichol phosphate-mannose biosynthesis regulatory protein [Lachnellula subtilissima]|uniref:Dolichol phosphate-mannose biosynthesis regulatory protein n=1 Tax=Lachnellula subtilissima TaxID=602034 RepID=A0A8H8RJ16_9HELO|nr:Dolichol phosphate-mannose biosynthesis regulatory protein [Lachnellula subtilissima]